MTAAERLANALRPLDVQQRHALAHALGLPNVVVARAAYGRSTNADAYVSICRAIGFDPLRDRKVNVQEPAPLAVDWKLLAMGLRIKRDLEGLNLRDAAAISDTTAATICRVEQARPVSAENLLKVCRFLGVTPLRYASHVKQDCNTQAEEAA